MVAKERKRRTNAELFIDTLRRLADGQQKFIGNKTMRDELGWDDVRYDRIWTQLMEEKKISSGRGRGGSVALADISGAKALSVFISYSHKDEELKNDLLKHLEPLKRLNLVDVWHDRKIDPGDKWGEKIAGALVKADIVLLLVSVDFINSKYCYDVELEQALERHEKKEATVIPIILRSCLWQHSRFAGIQALPSDGKAVASWQNKDDAFTNIAEGVRQVADRRMSLK